MKRFLTGLVSALVVCSVIVGVTPVFAQKELGVAEVYNLEDYEELSGEQIVSFSEAPSLSELVKEGKLPPVEKRLPDEPLVYEVPQIGKYGGELRSACIGPNAYSDIEDMREFYLFRTDPFCTKIYPEIARKYEFSEDMKTLTIYLREGMKWSDGEPFTVDDILFWWEDEVLNDELYPVKPTIWMPGGELAEFEKIDDYTLQIHFAVPYRPILGYIAYFGTLQSIFFDPAHYLKKWHIKYNPDANELAKEEGFDYWYQAFAFHRDRGPAQQDTKLPLLEPWILEKRSLIQRIYKRNPYFCGVDQAGNQLPYADRLVVDIIENEEVATMKLLGGELTHGGYAIGMKMENYTLYKENEKNGNYHVELWDTPLPAVVAFAFNLDHPDPVLREIFRDVRFRRAMSLAINRDEINEFAYLGTGTPMQATVHPSCSYYKEEWATAYANYDPEQANKLLDEMGLERGPDGFRLRPDGKPLAITLQYVMGAGMPGVNTVCELAKNYWEKVGVKVACTEVERSFYHTRAHAGQLDVGIWMVERTLELRCYVPDLTQWNPQASMGYAVPSKIWHDTGGESGEEPCEAVKAFFDAFDRWYLAVTDEEYKKRAEEVWDLQAQNLYLIGTVGFTKVPVALSNSLRNTPTKPLPFGDDMAWWGVTRGMTWFFEK